MADRLWHYGTWLIHTRHSHLLKSKQYGVNNTDACFCYIISIGHISCNISVITLGFITEFKELSRLMHYRSSFFQVMAESTNSVASLWTEGPYRM